MQEIKLLLDENVGIYTSKALEEEGYNVKSILKECPGIDDDEVLSIALEENRVLVTLDKDFGRLVFENSKQHVGVLFLRLDEESSQNITEVITNVVSEYGDKIINSFTTISEDKVRIREQ